MKTKISIILIIATGVFLIACSKKIIPGIKPSREYDKTQYDYFYVEGIKQKLMGNHGDALKYFEDCLGINPASDASYYQMAQIVIGKGDIETGKKYIIEAYNIDPENLWYNMLLAGIYHQENNLDSAILCYETATEIYPDKEDLQIFLARLYTENKNFLKAGNILSRLDEKYGVNEMTTLLLIDNMIKAGRFKEAHDKIGLLLNLDPDNISYNGYLAEIFKSTGETEKAKNVYRQLILRNPNDPAIQLSLCDFLLTERNYEELFDLLNVILINDRITREEKVSLVTELISNEDIKEKYSQKLELAIILLESDFREDDLISLLRPELLQKTGQLERAASLLEEMIKLQPSNYYAWEKLLFVYYEMKNYTSLEKMGGECATRFNRSIVVKLLYANGAIENKNYNTAIEELRKAEILAGDNKEMKLQVQTMKADIYYRMGEYEKAFVTFDEALKLDNKNITILNNYAYYLAERNLRLKEAEKMAKIVIAKDKGNSTFLDTYAWILYKRGKAREAARIMEKIIESEDNNDAEYYEHYGFMLKKMKKCKEAVKYWEKAIRLDESKENLLKEIKNCR